MEKLIIKQKVVIYQEIEKEATIYEYVGHKIKEHRKSKGISQTELSEIIGLSRASIGNIEAGRQKITLENLGKMCRTLNIKSSTLIPF